MRCHHASMGYALGLMVLFMANISLADEKIEVVTSEGSVMVGDAQGKAQKSVQSKSIVPAGNVLTTGPGARAVVRVGSDGFIVVGKNSQVEIGKTKKESSFFRQITGIVYYAMNSIKGNRRPVEVRTATATIGIRGTRFIVTDVEGRNEVGMRKGLVSVTSPEGEFEIHKQAELDEFEAFKKAGEAEIAKREREFEEYKANTQQEFIEYKREFSLGADRMASFDGKRVEDRPLSGETKNDMEEIESYADQWIKEVRD
jgi:FecR protein